MKGLAPRLERERVWPGNRAHPARILGMYDASRGKYVAGRHQLNSLWSAGLDATVPRAARAQHTSHSCGVVLRALQSDWCHEIP